jgi:hypothetical protein
MPRTHHSVQRPRTGGALNPRGSLPRSISALGLSAVLLQGGTASGSETRSLDAGSLETGSLDAGSLDAGTHPSSEARPVGAAQAEPRKLELGLEVGGVSRPSRGQGVQYALGPMWAGHATIVLLENLGFRLSGGMTYHDVEITRGALGVAGATEGEPSIRGPRVVGQLQPMLQLAPRIDAFALVGIGWQRFTANSISIAEPTPLRVSERSGVLVELPIAVGARYAVLRERMALALTFGFAAPLTESGALFDADAGTSQSLRQDTGELVRVDALPHFAGALSGSVSLDFFF